MDANLGLWSMVWGAGPMVKLVLLLLLAFSVVSWAIILYKVRLVKTIEKETAEFANLFWTSGNFNEISAQTKRFNATPLPKLFDSVYAELASVIKTIESGEAATSEIFPAELDRFKRILHKACLIERARMEKTLSFLATTGNTAPFIGLFGTVWGIMSAFRSIGAKGVANIAVVAPGISEALIATAVGLFAAIPAVVGYNYLLSKIDRISGEMDNFSTDLLNIVEKKIARQHAAMRTRR